MANSENSVAQTILYLRPQSGGVKVLTILANEPYVFKVAPSPEPVDIPLEGIPNLSPTSRLSPYTALHDHDRSSRESTPGPYALCQRVLRLGFDTIEEPSARGFEFGSRPASDVKVPYYGNKACAYFRIHYDFNSGALLITALDEIKVGSARLNNEQSLLLMAGPVIHCGGEFEFIVEFQIPATAPKKDLPRIGAEHRSKAILGKGTFGEVHKALNIRDERAFAIKVLSGGGESEMKEVNIMSSLCHENIVRYERAFRVPSGQICIVMELAVNDLETYRKARRSGKRSSYLSLPCIRSIGRQALSGLDYLHGKGFLHRDLKPQNILVTKWDGETDIPTIKLADFGLAGIGSEHQTLCGTEGYIAPEIIQADDTVNALEKQMDRWMNTIAPNRLPTRSYTNAVDIWALAKTLQELLQDVSSHVSLHRGKRVPVNKEPALRLIDRMMQNDPSRRPTAAECLKDPWMATMDTSDSRLAPKRGRSPTPSTSSPDSSTEQPLRKVMRIAFADCIATNESSTTRIMNTNCSYESLYHNGFAQAPRYAPSRSYIDTKSHSVDEAGQIQHVHPQKTQLTIQVEEDGRLSLTANGNNDVLMGPLAATRDENLSVAILADHAGPRGASSSLQDIAHRLLTALQVEGYRNHVAVVHKELSRSSISSLQVQQESQSSIILRIEFNGKERTSSFPNEAQPSVSHSIGSQSASPLERNDAAAGATTNNPRPRSYLEVMFNQSSLASFSDQQRYQLEPIAHPDQYSVPAIILDDGQVPRPLIHGSSGLDRGNTGDISDLNQSGLESNSSWTSTVSKGVTYPRHYDDPLAEISF